MPRFACLVIPRFPVATLRRAEPELRGCPLVVCEAERSGAGSRPTVAPRAFLMGVSREAERLGVRLGMTVAQALARNANLVVRPTDEAALAAARQALIDVATSVSPRVEQGRVEPGRASAYLDAEGLDRLFGSDAGIAACLARRAEQVGFEVGVGMADSKATARIAAELAAERGEAIVVPAGQDRLWLAPLPLAALAAVGEPEGARNPTWPTLAESFARLGLVRIGDLSRLSLPEIGSRFGPAGARLARIASGKHASPLFPLTPASEFREGVSLEYEMDSLEALLFLLRGLLDRLVHRLAIHGLACLGLRVEMQLADGGRVEREVGALAPTRDVNALALLARAALEANPPHAAVIGLVVTAQPDRPRAAQLDLFRPAAPAPTRLAMTLVRLATLCGPGRVGRPVPPTGHRPEAFGLTAFEPGSKSRAAREKDQEIDAPWKTALRAVRPPLRVEVFCEGGAIAYVRGHGLGGRAVVTSGPWRIDTEWWTETPCRRDYYDVQLSDGGVYRLYREPATGRGERWFIDGCYD